MSQHYTIVGGTGFLGSRVVRCLLEKGHRVRIAARRPERRVALLESNRVEAVHADLFEPATLAAAASGADGMVNATSLYLEHGHFTFESVHVEGAARLARAAREAGLTRFVHVSGIGSDSDAADPYVRARGRGEEAVRRAFPAATIVRPSAMFGPDDALLNAVLATLRRLPFYPLFGRGDTRLQPVHVGDVARGVAAILEIDAPARCYEFGGPTIHTYRGLVDAVASAAGLTARPVPVPFLVWSGLARVAERLPGAPLTRSQVALVGEDNVANEKMPGLRDLGVTPREVAAFVRHHA